MERVEKTTIQLPITVKEHLRQLKASPGQPYWEVVNALIHYFEKHAEDRTELWKDGMEVGKTKV